jgi:hypothetical protein
MPRFLGRLALLLLFVGALFQTGLTRAQQTQPLPQPDPPSVTFIDVWQVWWTVKGNLVFYSEATTKDKADQVAAALAMFPEKPLTQVRGPFKRTVGTTPLFPIVLIRDTLKDNLISGKASAQGWDLGTFYENDKLRIPAGTYSATLVFKNDRGIVLGPDARLGTSGDFLIQLSVKDRSNIFLSYGDKPEMTNGSVMFGAAVANGGAQFGPDPLKTMRLLFYEQNNTPMLTPMKTITVEIRDTIVRPKDMGTTPQGPSPE